MSDEAGSRAETTAATDSQTAETPKLWPSLLRSARYLRPYRKLTLVSAGVVVLSSLVSLLAPWPLKIFVDSLLGNQPLPAVVAL